MSGLTRLEVGPIRIDGESHRCFIHGKEVRVTLTEFRLLGALMSNVGRVLSRHQLLIDVWGITAGIETKTVYTHINRLRRKLGAAHRLVQTVRGSGYRMIAADPP